MPVPSDITVLSTTPASNSPPGSETPSSIDDYLRSHASFIAQMRAVIGGTVDANIPNASATITQVVEQSQNSGTTAGTSTAYTLTPSAAITGYSAKQTFWVTFHTASGAAPTLQISGIGTPPTLVRQQLDGTYASIAAGEIPTNHRSRVTLLSASQALVEDMPQAGASQTARIDVASASTVNLTSSAPNTRHINITGTTGITAFTVAAGQCYFVRFNAALTLTNNANIVTQTGANITTVAGDTCVIRATAANVVEVLGYVRSSHNEERCTAWVNFNGTGTVAIRDSYNVSSITDNGAGDYTINFATAMADANYSGSFGFSLNTSGAPAVQYIATGYPVDANGFRIKTTSTGGVATDLAYVGVQIMGGR